MTILRWRRAATVLLAAGSACSRHSSDSAGGAERSQAVDSSSPVSVERGPAFGADAPRGDPAPRDVPAVSAPFREAQVKLLESGAPPRRRLRYAWALGNREQLTIDMRTALAAEGAQAQPPDVPLPTVRVVIAIDPRSVGADGSLAYAWRVTSATVASDDRSPPQVADGMRIEVVAVQHLSGTGAVGPRGLAQSLAIDASESADEITARPIALQVLQTLWNVAAPLPDEEVGVGARWQRVWELAVKSARATQTDVFTLLTLDGMRGTLDDILSQNAPEQALSVPGMTHDAQAQTGSMLAAGDAKTRFDLTRLVADTRFQGTTTMVLAGGNGEGTEGADPRNTMVLRVDVELSGVAR
jgi:hypothetical protein